MFKFLVLFFCYSLVKCGLLVLFWQDEVRLRLFLDSIGFSDLSANKIKKWLPEDRRQFEIIQER